MGQFEINGNLAEYKGLNNCETFIQTVCRVRSYMMAYTLDIIQQDIDVYVDNGTENTGYVPVTTPVFGKFLIIKLGISEASSDGQIAFQFAHEYTHYLFYCKYGINKPHADNREEAICTTLSLAVVWNLYPHYFSDANQYVENEPDERYRPGAKLAKDANYNPEYLIKKI